MGVAATAPSHVLPEVVTKGQEDTESAHGQQCPLPPLPPRPPVAHRWVKFTTSSLVHSSPLATLAGEVPQSPPTGSAAFPRARTQARGFPRPGSYSPGNPLLQLSSCAYIFEHVSFLVPFL